MKKYMIIGLVAVILLPFAGSAQVKLNSNSQTVIGGDVITSDTVPSLWVKMSMVPAPGGGLNGYPARIGIGSSPSYTWIGERYTGWSMLGLYGEAGIAFTSRSNGNNVTFLEYLGISGLDKLEVTSNNFSFRYGTCISLTQTSDGRYKKDVKPLSTPLLQLGKLRGVSYLYDFSEHPLYGKQKRTIPGTEYETDVNPLPEDKSRHNGFIAQELQEVFPELVKADEEGNLAVDYIGLIPVIVEAMKEQQAIVTAQSGKINELQSEVEALRAGTTPKQTKGVEVIDAFLYQNAPNPFNTVTTIRYFLSSEAANASLYIFDMQGRLVESYPLSGAGEGAIEISASGLQPGMYLYSLLVNSQEVDTKRMVITE